MRSVATNLPRFALVFGVCGVTLAGCGGSSSSSQPTPVKASFSVSWAARSRTTAPASAQSLVLSLSGKQSGATLSVSEDRNTNPAAYSANYTSLQTVLPGAYQVAVNFYAGAGGTGSLVATGTGEVTLKGDGSGIGGISLADAVASVSVTTPPILFTPNTAQLSFTAKDSHGNLLALSPGSAFWSQADGQSFFSLTNDGVAKGLARGIGHVKVSVDGVNSSSAAVEAAPDPSGTPIVLDFDSLAAMPTQVSGTPVPVADQLSNQFLNQDGIVFSSVSPFVAVTNMPIGTAPSSPNCITGVDASGNIAYGQSVPVTFTFFDPLNPTKPGAVKSFSLTGDLDGISTNVLQLIAYDANGNQVATASVGDTGGEVLKVTSTTANIHQVVFLAAPTPFDGVALDNVTFGPVVPITP